MDENEEQECEYAAPITVRAKFSGFPTQIVELSEENGDDYIPFYVLSKTEFKNDKFSVNINGDPADNYKSLVDGDVVIFADRVKGALN